MEGRQEGSNHSTVSMICRLWAAKWRQSHGVIAQCNSAVWNPGLRLAAVSESGSDGAPEVLLIVRLRWCGGSGRA